MRNNEDITLTEQGYWSQWKEFLCLSQRKGTGLAIITAIAAKNFRKPGCDLK